MKKILCLFLASIMIMEAQAQKNVTLSITHKLGANNFAFNTTAQNDLMQNFRITRVNYYISGIEIVHDGGISTPVPNKYILAKDSNNVSELLGSFDVTNVEGIKFSIGVESPTNNADPSLQPPGSPLALQEPSMHWGWAAGYRFVALEGKTGANFNTTFELHGFGNANYFQQTVSAPGVVNGNNITINLDADYTQALKGINVTSGPIKHGVNQEDLDMLKNFRAVVFKAGSGPTSITNVSVDKNIRIYPNPNKGNIHIDLSKSSNSISHYKLMSMTGNVIESGNAPKNNIIGLKSAIPGNYILVLYNKEQQVFSQMIAVE